MQVSRTRRVSVTLPVDLISQLEYLSRELGCTRSAVCTQMLIGGAASWLPVVNEVGGLETPEGSLRRATGQSIAELEAVFDALLDLVQKREIQQMLSTEEGYALTQEVDGDL